MSIGHKRMKFSASPVEREANNSIEQALIQQIHSEPTDFQREGKWPSENHSNCQCPYCGHRDDVDIQVVREDHQNWRPSECSECFGEYWLIAENGTVTVKKSDTNANTFRIHHHYDRGDQSVTIQAPQGLDTKRAAVYIQFLAEDLFGDEATVTNLGIAAALVSFYGCKHTSHNKYGEDLDMYFARERLCPKYKELLADSTLMREGLKEFLKDHVDV